MFGYKEMLGFYLVISEVGLFFSKGGFYLFKPFGALSFILSNVALEKRTRSIDYFIHLGKTFKKRALRSFCNQFVKTNANVFSYLGLQHKPKGTLERLRNKIFCRELDMKMCLSVSIYISEIVKKLL